MGYMTDLFNKFYAAVNKLDRTIEGPWELDIKPNEPTKQEDKSE